jgi:hypothetical protein
MRKLIVTMAALGCLFAVSQTAQAQGVKVTFDPATTKVEKAKVTIDGKTFDRADLVKSLTARLKIANQKIKRLNPKAQSFTSINVTKDCTASVTCGNGTKLTCSIKGPGTCESGTISVACISAKTEEVNACGEPG